MTKSFFRCANFLKFVYINKSVKNNYAGKENVILIFENKKKLEILFFKMQNTNDHSVPYYLLR